MEVVSLYLEAGWIPVLTAYDGIEALIARRERPDLIVLDIMLLELMASRYAGPADESMPIIMLTARTEEDDKLLGWTREQTTILSNPSVPGN